MIPQPCFLVGSERSGTALLRLMLCHHPAVAWASEFLYAVELLAQDEKDGWPTLEAYYEYLGANRLFLHDGYAIDRSLDYPALVDSFLVQCRDRAGKSLVGATVHYHFDRLLRIWPDARFIHLLRDGRDVARSCIGMGWVGNVWKGAEIWLKAEQLWPLVRERLTADRYLEVTYEDLVRAPEDQLGRVCGFLGIAYDPAMLDYTRTTRYERPDPKLAAQWRTKLTPVETRLVEARIGPLLVERGYELSGLPPLKVTRLMAGRLRAQDRLARVRHRLKLMGPRLLALDVLSRRLGLKRLQARVRSRAFELINASLK